MRLSLRVWPSKINASSQVLPQRLMLLKRSSMVWQTWVVRLKVVLPVWVFRTYQVRSVLHQRFVCVVLRQSMVHLNRCGLWMVLSWKMLQRLMLITSRQVMLPHWFLQRLQVWTLMTLKVSRFWRMVLLPLSMVRVPWVVWLLSQLRRVRPVATASVIQVNIRCVCVQATLSSTLWTHRSRWAFIRRWRLMVSSLSLVRCVPLRVVSMVRCITCLTPTILPMVVSVLQTMKRLSMTIFVKQRCAILIGLKSSLRILFLRTTLSLCHQVQIKHNTIPLSLSWTTQDGQNRARCVVWLILSMLTITLVKRWHWTLLVIRLIVSSVHQVLWTRRWMLYRVLSIVTLILTLTLTLSTHHVRWILIRSISVTMLHSISTMSWIITLLTLMCLTWRCKQS